MSVWVIFLQKLERYNSFKYKTKTRRNISAGFSLKLKKKQFDIPTK